MGRLPGGLLHTNIISCGVFSAVAGSSVATAATMGSVALPYFEKSHYPPKLVLGSLAAGGALGNLSDRFFRAPGPGRGQVVDFIVYFGWFIGNVADIAIVGAAAFIAVLSLRGVPASGSSAGRHTHQATEHTA